MLGPVIYSSTTFLMEIAKGFVFFQGYSDRSAARHAQHRGDRVCRFPIVYPNYHPTFVGHVCWKYHYMIRYLPQKKLAPPRKVGKITLFFSTRPGEKLYHHFFFWYPSEQTTFIPMRPTSLGNTYAPGWQVCIPVALSALLFGESPLKLRIPGSAKVQKLGVGSGKGQESLFLYDFLSLSIFNMILQTNQSIVLLGSMSVFLWGRICQQESNYSIVFAFWCCPTPHVVGEYSWLLHPLIHTETAWNPAQPMASSLESTPNIGEMIHETARPIVVQLIPVHVQCPDLCNISTTGNTCFQHLKSSGFLSIPHFSKRFQAKAVFFHLWHKEYTAGKYFGELGMLTARPRAAWIMAKTYCVLSAPRSQCVHARWRPCHVY